jgi:hypothetical protein
MTLHESSLRIILRDNFKGGFFMREKMLVTQALDERDLLVKKISDKIDKASFVDTSLIVIQDSIPAILDKCKS